MGLGSEKSCLTEALSDGFSCAFNVANEQQNTNKYVN